MAELMRIFTEAKAYNFEKFPKVSGRKKQFKENQGRQEKMCDLVENYARECAEEAVKVATEKVAKETAENLFKNGAPYELVRKSIIELTDDELKAVYEKARKTGIKQINFKNCSEERKYRNLLSSFFCLLLQTSVRCDIIKKNEHTFEREMEI